MYIENTKRVIGIKVESLAIMQQPNEQKNDGYCTRQVCQDGHTRGRPSVSVPVSLDGIHNQLNQSSVALLSFLSFFSVTSI